MVNRVPSPTRLETEIRPPLIFPNILRIPQGREECMHWRVPIDDTHTRIYIMAFTPSPDGRRVAYLRDNGSTTTYSYTLVVYDTATSSERIVSR